MSNPNYAHAAGGYTGQPAYTATSTEYSLRKKWGQIWFRAIPLLAMIHNGEANWNREDFRNGNALLLPIIHSDASTTADGVTDANELTPITPYAISGMTQAMYNIAHYRHAMYPRASEKRLNNNTRANLLDGATQQLMDSFKDEQADDLLSANADSRSAMLGVQQVLSTSNTVGGIDQSSTTNWQSKVSTAVGAFTVDLIDEKMDAVDPRGGVTDMIMLANSESTGLNLFSKLRNALAPAERLVNIKFKANYGINSIVYRDATCVSENRLTSGVIVGLHSQSWYHVGDTKPNLDHEIPLQGTDAREHFYNMFVGVGCDHPARNWRLTGVN